MRFPRSAKIFRGQLDAAPFAGVFFLLVIFLLLSSSLVFPPGIRLQLPEAAELPGTDAPSVMVAVDASGQFYFENQVIAENKLKVKLTEAVKRAGAPLTLVIQADHSVKYDTVVRLRLLARAAGVREVLEGTQPALPRAATVPRVKP